MSYISDEQIVKNIEKFVIKTLEELKLTCILCKAYYTYLNVFESEQQLIKDILDDDLKSDTLSYINVYFYNNLKVLDNELISASCVIDDPLALRVLNFFKEVFKYDLQPISLDREYKNLYYFSDIDKLINEIKVTVNYEN